MRPERLKSALENPLATWADQIDALLKKEAEPVVLVGHSRAGLVISEVAERVPEKVGALIYVTAFMLRNGETLNDLLQQTDNIAAIGEGMVFHENGTLTLSSQTIRQYFYNKTPEPLVQMACERIVPEPAASSVTPIHVTTERFGTVPRAYIECAQDQGLTLNVQRAMQEALPVAFTDRLQADHSPFFSAPAGLVRSLERARKAIMPDGQSC